jgi:hypothetical protein
MGAARGSEYDVIVVFKDFWSKFLEFPKLVLEAPWSCDRCRKNVFRSKFHLITNVLNFGVFVNFCEISKIDRSDFDVNVA